MTPNTQNAIAGLKRVTKDIGHEIHDEELRDMIHMFDTNADGVIDKASS